MSLSTGTRLGPYEILTNPHPFSRAIRRRSAGTDHESRCDHLACRTGLRPLASGPLTTGWARSFGSPNDLESPRIVNAQASDPTAPSRSRTVRVKHSCRHRLQMDVGS